MRPKQIVFELIDGFFSVPYPYACVEGYTLTGWFDHETVLRMLYSRPPHLMVDRAAVFHEDASDTPIAITRFTITEDRCAGHYPGYPVFPFAQIGEMMAQCGTILLVRTKPRDFDGKTPFVVKLESMKSGNNGPVFPGDVLYTIAQKMETLHGYYRVQVTSVHKTKVVAHMDHLYYMPFPVSQFKKLSR